MHFSLTSFKTKRSIDSILIDRYDTAKALIRIGVFFLVFNCIFKCRCNLHFKLIENIPFLEVFFFLFHLFSKQFLF